MLLLLTVIKYNNNSKFSILNQNQFNLQSETATDAATDAQNVSSPQRTLSAKKKKNAANAAVYVERERHLPKNLPAAHVA